MGKSARQYAGEAGLVVSNLDRGLQMRGHTPGITTKVSSDLSHMHESQKRKKEKVTWKPRK